MKILVFLLIFFGVAFNAAAQFQHNTYQSISSITAYEESISNSFLFLIDDEIQQIVFNPARALDFQKGFVTGNFSSSGNTTVSSSGLISVGSGKWFFSAGGRSSFVSNTFDDAAYDKTINNIGSNRIRISEYARFNDGLNTSNESGGEFRLLKVFGDEKASYAAGIFAAYAIDRRTTKTYEFRTQSSIDEFYSADSLSRVETYNATTITDGNSKDIQEQFVAGVEFNRRNSNSDSRHRIYFQRNRYDRRVRTENTVEEIEKVLISQNTQQSYDRYFDSVYKNTSIPVHFRYDGYKNFRLNWLGEDFLFINAGAVYSNGNTDADFNETNIEALNDIIGEESKRDSEWAEAHDWFYSGRISAGYAVRLINESFNIFTGINPGYEVRKQRYFTIDDNKKAEHQELEHSAKILFPLYTSFSIANNFSIWGGANLEGNFLLSKYRSYTFTDSEILDISVPLKNKNNQKRFILSQRLFAGVTFNHSSGLSAIVNFGPNLSNLNFWRASVRYSF